MQGSLSAISQAVTTHDHDAAWVEHYAREWLPRGLVVLAVPPNPRWRPDSNEGEFDWQKARGWQHMGTRKAAALLAKWRPGYGVVLVTGHGLDGIDLDPRAWNSLNVEDEWDRLAAARVPAFGWNQTPSDGAHILVPSNDLAAAAAPSAGLDYRGGMIHAPATGNTRRSLLFLPGTTRPKYRDKPGPHYIARDTMTPAILDHLADYRDQSRATVSAYYAGHGKTLIDTRRPATPPPVSSMTMDRWTGQLPAWLARMFTEDAPIGTRSERWYALVGGCQRAGVPRAVMVELLTAWDDAHGGKYRGRIEQRIHEEAVKLAATNRGPSQRGTFRRGPARQLPTDERR